VRSDKKEAGWEDGGTDWYLVTVECPCVATGPLLRCDICKKSLFVDMRYRHIAITLRQR